MNDLVRSSAVYKWSRFVRCRESGKHCSANKEKGARSDKRTGKTLLCCSCLVGFFWLVLLSTASGVPLFPTGRNACKHTRQALPSDKIVAKLPFGSSTFRRLAPKKNHWEKSFGGFLKLRSTNFFDASSVFFWEALANRRFGDWLTNWYYWQ